MNTNNQVVQIVAIVGLVVIVVALIAAKVFAPASGIDELLSLIGGIVAVLVGLARLQSIGQQQTVNAQSIARVAEKVDVVHDKIETVSHAVDGINAAALANQVIVSEAKGEAKGDAAGFERGVGAAMVPATAIAPLSDDVLLTQEVKPGDPRYVPPIDTTNPRTALPSRSKK